MALIILLLLAILVGLLLAIAIALKYGHNRDNCFMHMNCTEQPNAPPLSPSEISEILKNNFHPTKIDESYDAIVIGSGISGMVVARVLAASGKKVVMLEQHDHAGGSCHTFELDRYEFDVGLHYVADMLPEKELYKICSAMTDGQTQWQQMDEPLDNVLIGEHQRYGRKSGRTENFREQLKEWFPAERDNIDAYFQYTAEALAETPWFFRAKFMPQNVVRLLLSNWIGRRVLKVFQYSSECLLDVMDRFHLSADAQTVISYYFVNYGAPPNNASFYQHSLFLMRTGSYPIGGAAAMTANMIRALKKSNGKVFTNANVEQIVFNGNKVNGVLVKFGASEYFVKAPLIVSTAPILETFNNLIPRDIAQTSTIHDVANRLHSLNKVHYAGLQAYIGLNGTAKDLELPSNNYFWFKNNNVYEFDRFTRLTLDEALDYGCPPIAYISFPSAKDPKWDERHPGVSTCQIISFVNPDWFAEFKDPSGKKSKKRINPSDYANLKNHFGELLVDIMLLFFPHLKKHISFVEFSTPLSQQYYMQNTHGEYYGLTQQIERFTPEFWCGLKFATDLPGLYLSGQDPLFCGVSSAFYSGLLTAGSILNRNLLKDLKTATEEQKFKKE